MEPIDYNRQQYAVYDRGRALTAEGQAAWREAFARNAGAPPPLMVLDLGSGTGRFTTLLADVFGGPVYGVEPSDRMREVALAKAPHENVTYLAGSADAIPLPAESCDLVVLFLVWQHVPDGPAAAAEIARVLRPAGRVLVCGSFSDRPGQRLWHRFFPGAEAVEARTFPTVDAVVHDFGTAGMARVTLVTVWQQLAPTLAAYAERLRLRAISTFEYLTEEEIERGMAVMDAAVAADDGNTPVMGDFDILVLAKS
jgi:ubiquinone/menaquinone biosynthesis C-methylase UbiE